MKRSATDAYPEQLQGSTSCLCSELKPMIEKAANAAKDLSIALQRHFADLEHQVRKVYRSQSNR